jgi:sortase B
MEGKDSVYGSIYLDCDSEPDFSGYNNPIYGHHMKDGSMFKDVVKFKEESFFKEHQYFEIYTPERTIHLKAVSCYYSGSDGIVRKTQFQSQEAFDAWVQERLEPCSFAEIPEVSVGSMFVLVTCSYEKNDARTLLYAVEVDKNGDVIPSK